jgi:septum formation protein
MTASNPSEEPLPSGNDRPALVLASQSPRRRELLRYLGVEFEAIATTGEEEDTEVPAEVVSALPPLLLDQHPTLLAWRKINAAIETGCHGVILGADTIVVIDNTILNKPRDEADARRMLRLLAGRTHTVYTGIALINTNRADSLTFDLVRSEVRMCILEDAEIVDYVATGEPLDKAGAYGIQGLGGRLVEQVTGSYTNVVGLPLEHVYRALQAQGLQPCVQPADAFRQWLADQGKDRPPCTAL